jgi:hypothetical protein
MGHLPNIMRPEGLYHRDFQPGSDLPKWFHDELKGLDVKLYFVWHPYKVLYDDVMNCYEGSLEDPRYVIGEFHGQEVWGYPMKKAEDDTPMSDNKWHIWRLCDPYGWCHVCPVETADPEYLTLLLRRLHLQAKLRDRGRRAYQEHLDEAQEERMRKNQEYADELFSAVQDENRWLLQRAANNYLAGKVEPTNPQKESIYSYSGQKNRSRIIRPLDDREGGLVLPEDLV